MKNLKTINEFVNESKREEKIITYKSDIVDAILALVAAKSTRGGGYDDIIKKLGNANSVEDVNELRELMNQADSSKLERYFLDIVNKYTP